MQERVGDQGQRYSVWVRIRNQTKMQRVGWADDYEPLFEVAKRVRGATYVEARDRENGNKVIASTPIGRPLFKQHASAKPKNGSLGAKKRRKARKQARQARKRNRSN